MTRGQTDALVVIAALVVTVLIWIGAIAVLYPTPPPTPAVHVTPVTTIAPTTSPNYSAGISQGARP